MGFASYADYLASKLWKGIRRVVLWKAKRRCVGCGGKARQVHHLEYTRENLSGSSRKGLRAVCRKCHEQIEIDASGRKTRLEEANNGLSCLAAEMQQKREAKRQARPERIRPSSAERRKRKRAKQAKAGY